MEAEIIHSRQILIITALLSSTILSMMVKVVPSLILLILLLMRLMIDLKPLLRLHSILLNLLHQLMGSLPQQILTFIAVR